MFAQQASDIVAKESLGQSECYDVSGLIPGSISGSISRSGGMDLILRAITGGAIGGILHVSFRLLNKKSTCG